MIRMKIRIRFRIWIRIGVRVRVRVQGRLKSYPNNDSNVGATYVTTIIGNNVGAT